MAGRIDLRRLPPLNALKGFEATFRRLSIRDAADELCLTHPAVIHQIQTLEEDLGVTLFAREGRRIVPTEAARELYGYVRRALEGLVEGAESVRAAQLQRPLRVQTYVTASLRWLAPRIPAFLSAHPQLRLLLSTCAPGWEFDDALGDVGLVYCEREPGPDYHWVRLFDYTLYPLCTPELAARLGPGAGPADLLRLPRIVTYSEPHHWEDWLGSGAPAPGTEPGVVVDTLALALALALEGSGVALANGPFADAELASGRLVCPVAHRVRCPGGWGLICRTDTAQQARVRAFFDWFAAQAASA